ncbi:uncharacterized protein LOC111401386 isoform X2 [Olea europaea var. sylvestris]|uniref:uncharacterized protein LOC111401386 isoform X1 n=1 Tax=Olea europaea var. sylvestris TaxID=158386 RepID=UPI000C1D1FDF|nr:uncharacterized protein LOC111401386 isoform X1 [Olea europaea var. sylvestris]XP_022884865.1 uncharacterized protein LOC111401386 isoform X2 [Olea europaea var. sylvestris]
MDAVVVKAENPTRKNLGKDRVRVQRKTLEAVLEQCQMALQQLTSDCDDDLAGTEVSGDSSSATCCDTEAAEFSDLLKSRIECDDFLEKLENAQTLLPHTMAEEISSWDVISENDLWEGGNVEVDREEYVLVRQEDILEGIASFMAGYLLSLKQAKDITPNQLQEALSKTFSVKKKGKLRKAWEGSKVVYNVASWGATAIGIYQNPAILRAASAAFWTSCQVISKLF